jgi:hypothetical protein
MFLGRPRVPVVQWLGHRPFTAVTRVRIPSGTPNTFKYLGDVSHFIRGCNSDALSVCLSRLFKLAELTAYTPLG